MLDTGYSDFLLLCTNYRLRQVFFRDKPMYESGTSRDMAPITTDRKTTPYLTLLLTFAEVITMSFASTENSLLGRQNSCT